MHTVIFYLWVVWHTWEEIGMDVPLANQTLLFVVRFFQGPSLLPRAQNKVATILFLFSLTNILRWYQVWLQNISRQTCLSAFAWLGFISKEKRNLSNLKAILNPNILCIYFGQKGGSDVENSFSYMKQRTERDTA